MIVAWFYSKLKPFRSNIMIVLLTILYFYADNAGYIYLTVYSKLLITCFMNLSFVVTAVNPATFSRPNNYIHTGLPSLLIP